MNKKQILTLIGLIILLVAIPVTFYLVRQQQIFKSRAEFKTTLDFLDASGTNVITETNNPNVKLRIRREVISPSPTPSQAFKRVFVTSTFYDGNLGGLSGADQKCQERANTANLGGTWKAWLSDTRTSAASRLEQSSISYKLADGTLVAESWADLIDGNLSHAINVDELGKTYNVKGVDTISDYAWTNTDTKGEIIVFNQAGGGACYDWTSSTVDRSSHRGQIWQTTACWTYGCGIAAPQPAAACNRQLRLYCFEQ